MIFSGWLLLLVVVSKFESLDIIAKKLQSVSSKAETAIWLQRMRQEVDWLEQASELLVDWNQRAKLPSCEASLLAPKLSTMAPDFNADQKYCFHQCHAPKCCAGSSRKFAEAGGEVLVDTRGGPSADHVTLVMSGSVDRLVDASVLLTAKRWSGPKVFVFSISRRTPVQVASAPTKLVRLRALASQLTNALVAVVYLDPPKKGIYPPGHGTELEDVWYFPINALRNIAADFARSNWVLPLDVDLVPSAGLWRRLTQAAARLQHSTLTAVVVPQFELKSKFTAAEPPADLSSLNALLAAQQARPSGMNLTTLGPVFRAANKWKGRIEEKAWSTPATNSLALTNYSRWWRDSWFNEGGMFRVQSGELLLPPEIPQLKGKHSSGLALAKITLRDGILISRKPGRPIWQPILLVRRNGVASPTGVDTPRWHEGYIGRGLDRVAFVTELRALGADIFVIRREFVTHVSHGTKGSKSVKLADHHLRVFTKDLRRLLQSAALVNLAKKDIDYEMPTSDSEVSQDSALEWRCIEDGSTTNQLMVQDDVCATLLTAACDFHSELSCSECVAFHRGSVVGGGGCLRSHELAFCQRFNHDMWGLSTSSLDAPLTSCRAKPPTAQLRAYAIIEAKAKAHHRITKSKQRYCMHQCHAPRCCPGSRKSFEEIGEILVDKLIETSETEPDITLVMAGSFDRLQAVEVTASRWPGPKVLVVAVKRFTAEDEQKVSASIDAVRQMASSWQNIRVVVVYLRYPPKNTKPAGQGELLWYEAIRRIYALTSASRAGKERWG